MDWESLLALSKRGLILLQSAQAVPEGPPPSVEQAAEILDRGFALTASKFMEEGIPSYETALALHAAVSVLSRPSVQWMADQLGTSFEEYNEYCLIGSIEQIAAHYRKDESEVSTLIRELIRRLLDETWIH
jgi:hypothetical protein